VCVYKTWWLFVGLVSSVARGAAVPNGGQLLVDVLRGYALAPGAGGGFRQGRRRHALVLLRRLVPARHPHHCLHAGQDLRRARD